MDEALAKQICKNFDDTRDSLEESLKETLNAVCEEICNSFDELIEPGGIFDNICKETDIDFRNRFTENILEELRTFIKDIYNSIHTQIYIFDINVFDHMTITALQNIINDNFAGKKDEFALKLSLLIDEVYGSMAFGANVSYELDNFSSRKIAEGAEPKIESAHDSILETVKCGISEATALTDIIKDVDAAIGTWSGIGETYNHIYSILEDGEGENTKNLCKECKRHIKKIIASDKVSAGTE